MRTERHPRSVGETNQETFTTIDNLVQKAEELCAGLKQLSESKHPLDIRRGVRKEVGDMTDQGERSKTVKAGSKTYFFDIKETKEGKSYLMITESRFKGEGEDRERQTIVVFPENSEDFVDAVSVMTARLEE